jgi:hypothetical protein
MLQRKQTVWLLLAAVCAALTFSNSFSFYSGQVQVSQYGHDIRYLTAWPHYINGQSGSILITVITAIIAAGSLWNIFNYKNRSRQFWVTLGLLALSLLDLLLYWRAINGFQEGALSLTAVFDFAVPVLLFFAAKGIRKDEKLVKSADRLR